MLHWYIILYLEDKKVDEDDVDDNANEDEKYIDKEDQNVHRHGEWQTP
jgi:hypothetical protein